MNWTGNFKPEGQHKMRALSWSPIAKHARSDCCPACAFLMESFGQGQTGERVDSPNTLNWS